MNYFRKILYFIIFFIPFSFALNLQRDADVAFLRLLIALTFTFFIFFIFYQNKELYLERFKNKQTYLFALFFLWTFLSSFWAMNPVWSIRKFLFFITIIPVYFLTIYLIDSRDRLNKILKYFILGGFIASIIGVLQFFSQFIFSLDKMYNFWAYNVSMFLYGQNFGSVVIQNQSWFVNIGGKDFFRAISLFPDPHTFALYLGLVTPLSIGFFLYNNKKNKVLFSVQLFFMLFAVLLTFSRGAYVGFLVSSLFISIFYFKYFKLNLRVNKKALASIFSGLVIVLFLLMNSVFGERLMSSFSLSDVSNTGRIQIWSISGSVFLDNPFFGVGLGNLPIFFDPTASVKSPINAHNTFLDISSELGLLGLVLFFGFLYFVFKNLKYRKDKFNFLRFGALWSFIWYLIHSFFETSIFSVPVLTAFSFMLAIAVILGKTIKGQVIRVDK